MSKYKYKHGIAVTVHNRHETAKETIKNLKKFMPDDCKFVIVDDSSDVPFPGATFRFEKQAGIAKAKNMCFELLDDCEHLMLFDDDCYGKVKGWEKPYVESKYPHLMYIFSEFSNGRPNGNRKSHQIEDAEVYANPCGCFLYYHHSCLDAVGGMDEGYGIWGLDHPDHSTRIHNAGLTPFKFMDVKASDDLFFSYDKEQTIERSVSANVRAEHIRVNQRKYNQLGKSAHFIPYKQQTGIILTSYFTGVPDPQRGEKWEADINQLKPLIESAKANNCTVHVITDSNLYDEINFIGASSTENKVRIENPYFKRWFEYRHLLRENKGKFENVWLTDCNDVEVLKNPFQIIRPGVLYCGWEKDFIGCQWMQNNHKSNFMQNFIKSNAKTPLLNAGVVGGRYDIVMEFLDRLCDMYEILPDMDKELTDMSLYNWTIYSHFLNRFETGLKITTEFKSFKANTTSLFKHK